MGVGRDETGLAKSCLLKLGDRYMGIHYAILSTLLGLNFSIVRS